MSESYAVLDRVPVRQQEPPFGERRKTVRHLLRDVRGCLTWQGEAGDVAREVSVLNISGAGAAVLAEDAPPVGQAIRLNLHGDSARMGPIESQLVDTSLDPSGRRVLHLRFIAWVPLDSFLQKYRERRLWERFPARASRGHLTWTEGAREKTMRGELLNISGGGAAVVCAVPPPPGVAIRLGLEAATWQAERIEPVEARLITTSEDPSGMRVAHLQFVEPCPMDLFELAVNGPE
jgi:hypothetical protein